MDFDILDVLNDATKEADAFEFHPASEFSMEDKLLYLNGLSLVMNADGDIDAAEKEYVRILIKSMQLEESILDDMVAFAQSPDKDTIQAFFRSFRRKPIAQLFLFDALMMTRRDGNVHEKETAVVNKIADQLEILKGTQQDIFDLFCHIKNKNWQESALYFSSHLLNPDHFKHLLAYHEVDFDELMKETEELRAKRILQVIANKMPKFESVEDEKLVKPTIDHDIIIPLLQAELDRGNAEVVNGKLTINDNEKFGVYNIFDEGIGFDKENVSLFSDENKGVGNTNVIAFLIDKISLYNFKDVNKTFFNDFIYLPACTLDFESVVRNRKFKLEFSCDLNKDFPFLMVNDDLYKHVADDYSRFGWSESPYTYYDFENKKFILIKYEHYSDSAGEIISVSDRDYIEYLFLYGAKLLESN